MIGMIVWLFVVIFVANALPGWPEIFWIVTFCVPPLILLPIIQALAR